MSRPFSTIGDAMQSKSWRADLRAADIPRRPPPQSVKEATPDRGHIEQPGERRPTTVFPPRPRQAELPDVLPRAWRTEDGGPVTPPAELMPPAPQTVAPPPDTIRQQIAAEMVVPHKQPPPPPEASEMAPAKKRKTRTVLSEAEKIAYTVRLLKGERTVEIARESGVSTSGVVNWRHKHGKEAAKLLRQQQAAREAGRNLRAAERLVEPAQQVRERTLMSAAPPALAELPTLQILIPGLEDYIQALVRKAVGAELKRRLGDD